MLTVATEPALYPNPLFPIEIDVIVPATPTVAVAVAVTGDGLPENVILGATVYPNPIVAPVPTHHGSVVELNPTAVTIPVIGSIVAIPTAICVGASFPYIPPVEMDTTGAVVYALPVVVNATSDGLIEVPFNPYPISTVALAKLIPGEDIVTTGGLFGS
jgi:hypothetical protein